MGLLSRNVEFIFTNNDLIGSKAISWGTAEDYQKRKDTPSHFSIRVFKYFVIESTVAAGVHVSVWPQFKQKHRFISSLRYIKKDIELGEIAEKIMIEAIGDKYDVKAILYFTYRILLKKFFRIPLPRVNRWQSNNAWFCNELYHFFTGQDVGMQSPNSLMLTMLDDPTLEACELNL